MGFNSGFKGLKSCFVSPFFANMFIIICRNMLQS